jgi:sugar lactone lactonase YvrE
LLVISVEVALAAGDQLGEGPFWDKRTGELLRVDIARGRVHGWSPSTGASWTRQYEGEVSAVIPRADGDGWVVAVGHRILLADGDTPFPLAAAEEDLPDNRFNDCKCDPRGRLWAGTMSKSRSSGTAALYRLTADRTLAEVITGTTISNGLAWSPDGERMYFIDSTTQRVDMLDFDPDSATVANRRPFAEIDAADGLPDGMTVDSQGGVWVCLFGGGQLRRYSPEGALAAVVPLPVTNPTSPVFGGDRLETLYVTSARHRLSERQLAAEPLAGALLAVDAEVTGLPGNAFRADR